MPYNEEMSFIAWGINMTLRRKTLLIVGLTLVGLIVLVYIAAQIIVLNGFRQLEDQNTRDNVQRAINALNDDLNQLKSSTRDYSYWDDAYAYMQGTNPDFITTNYTPDTFANLRLNQVIYINTDH